MKTLLLPFLFLILFAPLTSQTVSILPDNHVQKISDYTPDQIPYQTWLKKSDIGFPAQSLKSNHQAKTISSLSENDPFESPDSVVAQNYNTNISKWENYFKAITNFDNENNSILRNVYYWDDTLNQWYYVFRENHKYNLNNKLIHSDYSNWNIESSQWIYDAKYDVSYTDSLVTSLGYNWRTNNWYLNSKTESVYNDNQDKTEEIGYSLRQSDSTWRYSFKNIYKYDASGNQITDSSLVWDTISYSWATTYKREHFYNAEGNLTGRIFYWPGQFTGVFSARSKYYVYYDNQTRQTETLYYSKGEYATDWILDGKNKRSYYGDTLVCSVDSSLVEGRWYCSGGIDFYKRRGYYLYVYYNYNGSEMVPYYRFFEYNSGLITNENSFENNSNKITIYPNPASDILYFSNEDKCNGINISLIDLQGKIVLQKYVGDGSSISIKNVPKGLYIYRVAVNDNIITGKIVIE